MPLYEYQCDACAHRFEVIQKFSDSPLETCEKCGGQVRKLLSSPAIQFKGSGWYITDYARAGKSESKSESTSDAKSDAKSESATKSDSATKSESSASSSESKPATTSTSS
jgi:putative FmdB family regulatory protein